MMYARRQQVKEAAVEKSADTRWALEGKNYRSHGNAHNHVLNMVLITDARFEMSPKAQACILQVRLRVYVFVFILLLLSYPVKSKTQLTIIRPSVACVKQKQKSSIWKGLKKCYESMLIIPGAFGNIIHSHMSLTHMLGNLLCSLESQISTSINCIELQHGG